MAYVTQRIFPVSDVTVGSWTTTPLWSKIDEYPASDTDFISSPTISTVGSTSSAFFGGDTNNVTPAVRQNHRVVVRAKSTGVANMHVGISIHQGFSFLVSYRSMGVLTSTFQEYTYDLTQSEMNSITNYNDIVIEAVGVNSTGGGVNGSVQISSVYLETPSRTQTTTHSVDAQIAPADVPFEGGPVIWNSTLATWNGGTIYWGASVKTHSVDALLDAGVQQRTVAHTVNALLFKKRTLSHLVNAALLKKQIRTHSVDALRLRRGRPTHLVNAALLKKQTRTYSVTAIRLKKQLRTHGVDAIRLRKTRPTHLVNALITRRPRGTHAVDATLLKKRTLTHTIDARTAARVRRQHTVSAALQKIFTRIHTVDTSLLKRRLLTHSVNVILHKKQSASHTANAVILKKQSRLHAVDASISSINIEIHGVDAEIQAVPQFVELVSAGGSNSIVLNTTPVEGELMVAQITCRASKHVTSAPTDWELIRVDVTADTTESGTRQYVYYKVAGNAESGSYTWELGDI